MIDIIKLQAAAREELASEGVGEPTPEEVNARASLIFERQEVARLREEAILKASRWNEGKLASFAKNTQTASGQGLYLDGNRLTLRAGNINRKGAAELVLPVYVKSYGDKEDGYSPSFIMGELEGMRQRLLTAAGIIETAIASAKGENLVAKGGVLNAVDHSRA